MNQTSNQSESIEQKIYETLREAILNSRLTTGTQLVEQSLCNKFGASRTPVRNALKRLSDDHLVDLITNRGAFVIQPSKEDIMKAYEVREEMEIVAVKLAMKYITDEDIQKLSDIIIKEYEAIEKGELDNYLNLNKSFHMAIVKISKNPFLEEFAEGIINRVNTYLQIYDRELKVNLNDVSHIKDHEEMVQLIKTQDVEALKEVSRKHIQKSLLDLKLENIEYTSIDDLF